MGRADIAMRLRIDQFTNVRVVAEMNDGELHMDTGFTRASGGCSEPPPFLELKEARKRIGEMKFRAQASTDNDDVARLLSDGLSSVVGDVNSDGIFDSADLVKLFQVGEYEDDIEDNSLWSEGDWNCDGDFDTADLVVAFQAGTYRS